MPLQLICKAPVIDKNASQRFVGEDLDKYTNRYNFISKIADKAGVPRIYYELMAWDGEH
jgi:hypothetical protein